MIVFDIRRRKPTVENLPVVRKTIFQQIAEKKQAVAPPEIGPPKNLHGAKIDTEALQKALDTVPSTEDIPADQYDPAKHSKLPNGRIVKTPAEHPGIHPIGLGKLEYARWLGVYVYPKFHRGTLVTLSNMPFVPNAIPKVWWKVTEIQELHYVVQIDKEVRQPKAVGIQLETSHQSYPIYYPPSLLRVLQPEEIKAIDSLRNKARNGRDAEATGFDGTESSVDRSTGESS